MKKLFNLFTILFAAAVLFTGCSSGSDDSGKPSGGTPGSGSNSSSSSSGSSTTNEFADCTVTLNAYSEVEFSDGNWTFRDDWSYHSVPYKEILVIAVNGSNHPYTSGNVSTTFNLESINITTGAIEFINEFDQANDAGKKQKIINFLASEDEIDENVTISENDITINGHNITVYHEYTASELSSMASVFSDLNLIYRYSLSKKTNADKTKYVFDCSNENEMIYFSKN